MAAVTILTFCIVLLLLEITSLDRKRAGGSRSARGGRSRSPGTYSRPYGVRSYHNVVLSGRIVTGSSPFTSSTWRSAAIMGTIYGGRMYMLHHPYERKLPPICTNNKERSPEGRAYGYFICPRETEPEDFQFCCGAESREYCCNKTMAQIFYSEQKKSTGTSIGVIIGIVVAIIVIIVIAAYCCKKKQKHAEDVVYKMSKKERRPPQRLPPLHPLSGLLQPKVGQAVSRHVEKKVVDLNRPTESFEGAVITPQVPPPSYNAATTTGFDAVIGLPFISHQPQQPLSQFDGAATYSNGNPTAVVDRSLPSPQNPQPLIDEATNLQTNGPQFPLPGGLPHSMSGPTYLSASPNSSLPEDQKVSFHPRSASDAAYSSTLFYSAYSAPSQS